MNKKDQVRRRIQDDNGQGARTDSDLKPKQEKPKLQPVSPQEATFHRTIKCLVFLLVVLSILFLVCIFFIFLAYPTETYPVQYSLPEPPRLENATSISHFNTSTLLQGKLQGPEYICLRNGLIYTGTADGKVLEVNEATNEIRIVARLGKGDNCGTYETEPDCGRPLGLEFDADGFLLVVDAYLGIFRVDVITGLVQTVVSPSLTKTEPRDLKMTFLNDLEVTDNGEIFFTDSSIFTRRDLMYDALMGAANGRLLKYDPLLNLVTIATSNLAFPNGVLLSRFQDYILVAETTRARISKFNIKGINAGATETWVENLPCLPDNLHLSPRGTVWVACGSPRYQGVRFSIVDFFGNMVWLRRILQEFPKQVLMSLLNPNSMLLELSAESGEILRVIVDEGADVLRHASDVAESGVDGRLYVGSFKTDYIAVVEL